MSMSRLNKFCLISLLLLIAVIGSGCGFYYKVMAQKNLVDGAQAYKERAYHEAIEKFRYAVEFDPELTTTESRTAQLFLARTLHSMFASKRDEKDKAREAIKEYEKALPGFIQEVKDKKEILNSKPDDEKAKNDVKKNEDIVGNIVSSVGSLYENLQETDKWREWQTNASKNAELPNFVRANSLVSLAAKKNSCANEISDDPAVKKTTLKDGKAVFEFVKPTEEGKFDELKECVDEGTKYIDEAVELDPNSEAAWSFKTSLLLQSMRVAEMEGKTEEKAEIEKKVDEAKAKYEALKEARIKREEEEARKKAEEAAKKKGKKAPKEQPKEESNEEPKEESKEEPKADDSSSDEQKPDEEEKPKEEGGEEKADDKPAEDN